MGVVETCPLAGTNPRGCRSEFNGIVCVLEPGSRSSRARMKEGVPKNPERMSAAYTRVCPRWKTDNTVLSTKRWWSHMNQPRSPSPGAVDATNSHQSLGASRILSILYLVRILAPLNLPDSWGTLGVAVGFRGWLWNDPRGITNAWNRDTRRWPASPMYTSGRSYTL